MDCITPPALCDGRCPTVPSQEMEATRSSSPSKICSWCAFRDKFASMKQWLYRKLRKKCPRVHQNPYNLLFGWTRASTNSHRLIIPPDGCFTPGNKNKTIVLCPSVCRVQGDLDPGKVNDRHMHVALRRRPQYFPFRNVLSCRLAMLFSDPHDDSNLPKSAGIFSMAQHKLV